MLALKQTATTMSQLLTELSTAFSQFENVHAVVLGGSTTNNQAQIDSDIDVYVYLENGSSIDPKSRMKLALERGVIQPEINNQFWEDGDEWKEPSGVYIDLMYREKSWIEQQLKNVLEQNQASLGYTTCFWYSVLHSSILFDRTGWFSRLKHNVNIKYPEALRETIIAKNYPILRQTISSYKHQLQKASNRGDYVSLNHRATAFLASYFDILFALNKLPHPGEKRLVHIVNSTCSIKPKNLGLIPKFIEACATADPAINAYINELVDELDQLVKSSM